MINGEERVLICFSRGGKSEEGGFVKDGVSQVMVEACCRESDGLEKWEWHCWALRCLGVLGSGVINGGSIGLLALADWQEPSNHK
jgi:hypothetical protein